jgi:hypothetical protein
VIEDKDARDWAINTRWDFLQALRLIILQDPQSRDRLEQFHQKNFSHDAAVLERAVARLRELGVDHKPATPRNNTSNNNTQPRQNNNRRFSKKQRTIISPKSFLPTRLSGIRDVIFELLSLPQNLEGLTVPEMEEPIRTMLKAEGFIVPDEWVLPQLLRVHLANMTHHVSQADSGICKATTIPARQLSRQYLNTLRAQKCLPGRDPLDYPAMLHIFIERHSGAMSKKALEASRLHYETTATAIDAVFGRCREQPETSEYTPSPYDKDESHNKYPMRIHCVLPRVRGSLSLLEMLHQDAKCKSALEELEEYARQTLQDKPRHRGHFVYRIIVMGIDGGSVNNDSFSDMREAYPRLEGQLLICEDRTPGQEASLVRQRPMMDFMHPACLLPAKGHQHVIWGLFDISMLADEWSPTGQQQQLAPQLRGSPPATLEHYHQILACRKLLLSNSLLYYYRDDISISGTIEAKNFAEPDKIRNQTPNGRLFGRNAITADRCIPQAEPFARDCCWCGRDTVANWAHSAKLPQKGEPLLSFVCDRLECYHREMEERKQITTQAKQTFTYGTGFISEGNHSSGSSSIENDSDDKPKSKEPRSKKPKSMKPRSKTPRYLGSASEKLGLKCRLWRTAMDRSLVLLLDPLLHNDLGGFVEPSDLETQEFVLAHGKTFSYTEQGFKNLVTRHRKLHQSHQNQKGSADQSTIPPATTNPSPKPEESPQQKLCPLWPGRVTNMPLYRFLDPLIHDSQGRFIDVDLATTFAEAKNLGFFAKGKARDMWNPIAGHKIQHERQGSVSQVPGKQIKGLDAVKPTQSSSAVSTESSEKQKRALIASMCEHWSNNRGQSTLDKYRLLDPIIHDNAGNFVDLPLSIIEKLLHANSVRFNTMKRKDLKTMLATHRSYHENAGTVAPPQPRVSGETAGSRADGQQLNNNYKKSLIVVLRLPKPKAQAQTDVDMDAKAQEQVDADVDTEAQKQTDGDMDAEAQEHMDADMDDASPSEKLDDSDYEG